MRSGVNGVSRSISPFTRKVVLIVRSLDAVCLLCLHGGVGGGGGGGSMAAPHNTATAASYCGCPLCYLCPPGRGWWYTDTTLAYRYTPAHRNYDRFHTSAPLVRCLWSTVPLRCRESCHVWGRRYGQANLNVTLTFKQAIRYPVSSAECSDFLSNPSPGQAFLFLSGGFSDCRSLNSLSYLRTLHN